MKKIGILTFQSADNYGAVLQCFAMQEYLESIGYDVKVINYVPKYFEKKYSIYTPFFSTYWQYKKSQLKHCLLHAIKSYGRNIKLLTKYKKRKNFNKFRKNYFNITDKCVSYNEFLNMSLNFDIISVGSDQVWSKRIMGGKYDPVFMLQGVDKKVKKMSYAASCGGIFHKDDFKVLKNILSDYNFLSAREKSLAEQISTISGKECYHVCDPVFLLSKEQWVEKLSICKSLSEKKYILAYNVSSEATSSEYFNLVDKMAKEIDCEIYEIGSCRRTKGKGKLFDNIGPVEFIQMIIDSEFVFTTSFHATALSLIFEKQFNVFLPNSAERIISILEKMNLMNKLVIPGGSYNLENIKYDEIAKLRNEFIMDSVKYLNMYLINN